MSNRGWARAYTRDEQLIGTPHGKVLPLPYPGGQRIGRGLPVPNSPFAQQTESKKIELAHWSGSVVHKTREITVDVNTPSIRLTCGLQLFVNRDGKISDKPISPGLSPCIASVYAMGQDPNFGFRGQMQPIATYNPPAFIPIANVMRSVRLVIAVANDNWVFGPDFTGGTLCLVANWEPNVEMEASELNRLYANCGLYGPSIVKL